MPLEQLIAFGVVFGVAFGSAFGLTPLMRRFGLRHGIMAIPGGRRQHQGAMPRTGGLALFIAFGLAVLVAQLMPIERTDPKEVIRLIGLLLGAGFITFIGYLDDKYDLSPLVLYLGQLLTGAIAVVFLIFIETFNNPLSGEPITWPYWVTVAVTLFWMGLMMNTVNFLDGSDGLAAGVIAIAAFMIFVHAAFQLNQVSVGLLALALLGALLGFLPYNFPPAKIFMGGGAYFLGYALGVLSIIGGAKMATVLLVMGLPLMDLGWQASSRLMRGQNPMQGDRGHLHFRLIDAGVSPVVLALGYYAFCAAFGLIALTTTSQLFKLVALIVMFMIVGVVFTLVSIGQPHLQPTETPHESE
ncbi:MAG: MraY family glycosyltransferase [Anaerolineales bacterium]